MERDMGLPRAGDVLFLAAGYTGILHCVKIHDIVQLQFVCYTSI